MNRSLFPIDRPVVLGVAWFLLAAVLGYFLSHEDGLQTGLFSVASLALGSVLSLVVLRRGIPYMLFVSGLLVIFFSGYFELYIPFQFRIRFASSISVFLLLFGIFFLISKKRIASLLLSAIVVAVVNISSMVKLGYTGVPLLWPDFELLLSTWPILLTMEPFASTVGICGLVAVSALLWFEPAARIRHVPAALYGATFALFSTFAVADMLAAEAMTVEVVSMGNAQRDPMEILLGSMVNMAAIREPAGKNATVCCAKPEPSTLQVSMRNEPPHLLIVLEESTFDPSSLKGWPTSQTAFFPHSHPLMAEVVGGSTWVAEYSVLHGVSPHAYGPAGNYINLLGPGRIEGRLPRMLATLGYSTTTVYPVDRRFYGAERFHQSLGMHEFIDCPQLEGCSGKAWPEIPDSVFFDKALALFQTADRPAFVFFPTMRQHSPHRDSGERDATEEEKCADTAKERCEIARVYGKRLNSSLREYESFLKQISPLSREVVVIVFGDHIPADVAGHWPSESFTYGKAGTFFTAYSSKRGYLTRSLLEELGSPKTVPNSMLDLVAAMAIGMDGIYFSEKKRLAKSCIWKADRSTWNALRECD